MAGMAGTTHGFGMLVGAGAGITGVGDDLGVGIAGAGTTGVGTLVGVMVGITGAGTAITEVILMLSIQEEEVLY